MRDQTLVMERFLNRTGGQGYIYCLKVDMHDWKYQDILQGWKLRD